ncbi:MAG: hypothetical protein JWM36_109 [Hyphomicrobiales bacterium]|nr:hypothetical protein [Hyphomicrobiales bacterium]
MWIESGLAWAPFLMQRLDHEYLMRVSEAPLLKKLPSEYMQKMFYTLQPMESTNMKLLQSTSLGDVHQSFSFAQSAESIIKSMGEGYFRKLAENTKPVFFTKTAQGRGWAASGEFPVVLMSHGKNAQILKDQKIDVRLSNPLLLGAEHPCENLRV